MINNKRSKLIFLDESGISDTSNQPVLGFGILKYDDTSLITEKLYQKHFTYHSEAVFKRKEIFTDLKANPRILIEKDLSLLLLTTRHYEYHFTDITLTTLNKYIELIDTVFTFPLYFSCIIIDKSSEDYQKLSKDYWDSYLKFSKQLVKNNIKENETVFVLADYSTRPYKINRFFEDEINTIDGVGNTIKAHSETFILLQLTDLFLGAVCFQYKQKKGFINKSNRSIAKAKFCEHLSYKLGIKDSTLYSMVQNNIAGKPITFEIVEFGFK